MLDFPITEEAKLATLPNGWYFAKMKDGSFEPVERKAFDQETGIRYVNTWGGGAFKHHTDAERAAEGGVVSRLYPVESFAEQMVTESLLSHARELRQKLHIVEIEKVNAATACREAEAQRDAAYELLRRWGNVFRGGQCEATDCVARDSKGFLAKQGDSDA